MLHALGSGFGCSNIGVSTTLVSLYVVETPVCLSIHTHTREYSGWGALGKVFWGGFPRFLKVSKAADTAVPRFLKSIESRALLGAARAVCVAQLASCVLLRSPFFFLVSQRHIEKYF